MQGRAGVSAVTPNRLVFDAGRLYLNIDLVALETPLDEEYIMGFFGACQAFHIGPRFVLDDVLEHATALGATRGGTSFDPGRSLREVEADGPLGPVYGLRRRQSVEPIMTATLLEMSRSNLTTAIAGATDEATPGGLRKMSGGPIVDDTFIDNVALVATYSGSYKPVVLVIENALVAEVADVDLDDKDEVALQVTFRGHFDPGEAAREPWIIYHPGEH